MVLISPIKTEEDKERAELKEVNSLASFFDDVEVEEPISPAPLVLSKEESLDWVEAVEEVDAKASLVDKMQAGINQYEMEALPLPTPFDEYENDYSIVDSVVNFGGHTVEGFQKGINNIGLFVEDASKAIFNVDIDLPEFEIEEPTTTAEGIAQGLGQVGSIFIPGGAIFKGGKLVLKAARSVPVLQRLLSTGGLSQVMASKWASLIGFEGSMVLGEQLVFDPNDPILSNLIQSNPNIANPVTEFLATDPTDTEAMNRLRMAIEATTGAAVFGTIWTVVGNRLSSVAAKTDVSVINKLQDELTGIGDSVRTKQYLLEEYLNIKGFPADDIISQVRQGLTDGDSIEELTTRITGRKAEDVFAEVRTNEENLKNVLIRQHAESNLGVEGRSVEGVESMHLANSLHGTAKDEWITETTGQSFTEWRTPLPEPTHRGKPIKGKLLSRRERATADVIRPNLVVDKLSRVINGFGAEPAEIKKLMDKAGKIDNLDPAMSAAVLIDKLPNTILTRRNLALGTGKHGSPVLPPDLNNMFATPVETGLKGFSKIFEDLNFGEQDIRDFMTWVSSEQDVILRQKRIEKRLTLETRRYELLRTKKKTKLEEQELKKVTTSLKEIKKDFTSERLRDPNLSRILEEGRTNELFQKALPDYAALTKYALMYRQRAGKIGVDGVSRLIQSRTNADGQYFYAPQFIDPDAVTKKQAFKSLKKGDLAARKSNEGIPLMDSIEAFAQYMDSTIVRSEENIAKRALYDMLDRSSRGTDAEMKAFVDRVYRDVTKNIESTKSVREELASGMRQALRNAQEAGEDIDAITSLVGRDVDTLSYEELIKIFPEGQSFRLSDGRVFDTVWRDGKASVYEILDEDLAKFVKQFGQANAFVLEQSATDLVRWGAIASRAVTRLSSEAITKSPGFAGPNFFRDGITGAINSVDTGQFILSGGNLRGLAKTFDPEFMREMIVAGATGATKTENLVKSVAALGKFDRGSAARKMLIGIHENLWSKMQKGWIGYSDFVTKMEIASRAAEYRLAKEAGASPELAGWMANEVTTNFMKKGANKAFNTFASHTVFLNASMQSMYKLARTAKHKPKAVATGVLAYGLYDFAASEMSSQFPEYDILPEHTKNFYTIFPNFEDEEEGLRWAMGLTDKLPALSEKSPFVATPIPFDIGTIGKLVVKSLKSFKDPAVRRDLMGAYGRAIMQMTDSVGMPTVLRPIFQHARNKNNWDQDIIPAYYNEDYNIETLYKANTNNFAILLSDWSKKAHGLFTEAESEAFIHPLVADHYIKSYFPGLASYVVNIADKIAKAEEFGETPDTIFGSKSKSANPLKFLLADTTNRWVINPTELSGGMSGIFEMKKAADALMKSDRVSRARNTLETFKNMKIESPFSSSEQKVLAMKEYGYIDTAVRSLQISQTAIDSISKNGTLSGEEKASQILELKRQQNALATRFLQTLINLDPEQELSRFTGIVQESRGNE